MKVCPRDARRLLGGTDTHSVIMTCVVPEWWLAVIFLIFKITLTALLYN